MSYGIYTRDILISALTVLEKIRNQDRRYDAPFTSTMQPVINAGASKARNPMVLAISSG
jgi:hypothetical protein